jgi:hypothetical protein
MLGKPTFKIILLFFIIINVGYSQIYRSKDNLNIVLDTFVTKTSFDSLKNNLSNFDSTIFTTNYRLDTVTNNRLTLWRYFTDTLNSRIYSNNLYQEKGDYVTDTELATALDNKDWEPVSYTFVNSTTITITANIQKYKKGLPLKYITANDEVGYAIITNVSGNNITIPSNTKDPLLATAKGLYLGKAEKVIKLDFFIFGVWTNYVISGKVNINNLFIQHYGHEYLWGHSNAQFVYCALKNGISLGTEPWLNVMRGRGGVFSGFLSHASLNGTNYIYPIMDGTISDRNVLYGDTIDINVLAIAKNGVPPIDARNLAIHLWFVLE